jgi:hypothetical protein
MATNIRLSVAFGQQEKPLKWSGGSGSADALLAAVKAKFRAKGELWIEAHGAPVTDATRLRNGLVVTLRKGRPPGGIPRAKADAAPRSPVSVLDLDAPKVPPLRLAPRASGAAAAVSRVDDLMGRILAYVRAAEGVALPAVSRRFKARAVIPSGRGRYFLETEEDSLRRFSRARAEHRKGHGRRPHGLEPHEPRRVGFARRAAPALARAVRARPGRAGVRAPRRGLGPPVGGPRRRLS